MLLANLTLPSPEENLACDEVLLGMCERGTSTGLLRFWQPPSPFIVLGHGSRTGDEVNVDEARKRRVPVLRRYSGGGTVVQGPWCLNYTLILHIPERGALSTITGTTAFILRRHATALQVMCHAPISVSGQSDLTIEGKKFSGNAQRRGRTCLLFHGTFLISPDIALIEAVLPLPVRQPEYRHNRTHGEFLRGFPATPEKVKEALQTAWEAGPDLTEIPYEEISHLAASRYSSDAWTFRR